MKRKIWVPAWLFLTAAVLFDEWMLRWWTAREPGQPVLLSLVAAAFGMLLGVLVSFISDPHRAKGAAVAMASVLAVIWFALFVVCDTYQEFLTPATIFGGAAGVARDFLAIAVKAVFGNLWRLAVLLVPVVCYGIFADASAVPRKVRRVLGLTCAVLYLAGFGVLQRSGAHAASYRFDSAVRKTGLHGALLLETLHGISGSSAEPEFLPAEQISPTETQPLRETDPTEEVFRPQVLPLDFEALAEAEEHKGVRSLHEYVASRTPGTENEFTGLFAEKNLIFITAEAFSSQVVDPELTPTLYRLATEGIRFAEYYQPAWGGSTTSGEFSNLLGIVPVGGGKCMEEACRQDLFFTVGESLRKQGYYSAAYHNHSYTYYNRDETHTRLGYDTFLAMGNGMEAGVSKRTPESDLEMMEFTVPLYLDRQPFSVYYMTMSGHALYSRDGNAMARKNYHRVEGMEASEAVKCYLAANLELEDAMAHLVQQLEKAGIADDTVIVLAADHYPYGLEKGSAWGNGENYLRELYGTDRVDCFTRDRSTLIIWSGSIEGENISVEEPAYSLDILPTLLNLFGVPFDSRLFVGRDVFSGAEALVLWPDHSWRTERGFYHGPSGRFWSEEDRTEEAYQERIHAEVANRITYSEGVCRQDYFNVLAPLVEQVS